MAASDDWLNRRYYGGDLPPEAERALHRAGLDWSDEAAAEGHIQSALALAPEHLATRLGAYKFYFYRHRLAEALPHAEACLAHAARTLGLSADWRQTAPGQANFTEVDGEVAVVTGQPPRVAAVAEGEEEAPVEGAAPAPAGEDAAGSDEG